ncbi:8235_t:CDS:2, partial [Cetraspora pellucida]
LVKEYEISRTTLHHAIENNSLSNHRGLLIILTKHEETQLVGYCINIQKLGFGLTWSDHPKLSFCVSQELSEACAQRANVVIIKDHFDKLKQIINEYSLIAMQIWNIDKTGYVFISKLEKVILKKEGAPLGTVMGFTSINHKSYINYTSVDFYHKNKILLYVLSPHTMHVLQLSEIPFAKLKNKYDKKCAKYKNNNNGK